MIAFFKIWIFAIILFQNYFFMRYIDEFSLFIASDEESFPSKSKKFYLTMFSIIRLMSAVKLETTYHSIIRFGVSLFFSPLIYQTAKKFLLKICRDLFLSSLSIHKSLCRAHSSLLKLCHSFLLYT